MKKTIIAIFLSVFIISVANAQEEEIKVKKTSSPTQKVHNVFSKNKKYNGVKVKHKKNGRKTKAEVKKGSAEIKNTGFIWRKEESTAA